MQGGDGTLINQQHPDARRLHDAYIGSVDERIDRFSMHMDESGFALSDLTWTDLDSFDDLWFWAQDHLVMFDDRRARLDPDTATAWHPHMPGTDVPSDWPSWTGCTDLVPEAHEFASGLAALLSRFAIQQWGARWVLHDDRSKLEIRRPFEHPAAKFGPVLVEPERLVAEAVRGFLRHPLWHQDAPWHQLHRRVRQPFADWSAISDDAAERFHRGYVAGHSERLTQFRSWLDARGFDRAANTFAHVADLEHLWSWAAREVIFAEQTTLPRHDMRSWYPAQPSASSTSDLPRWTTTRLSAESLTFASGLAAVAAEIALEQWGAHWVLGGRRGDQRGANRTHLELTTTNSECVRINVELEVAAWLASAIVRAKRRTPQAVYWPNIADAQSAARLVATCHAPLAPWVGWHAQFETCLLPNLSLTRLPEPTAEPEPFRLLPLPPRPLSQTDRSPAVPMVLDDPQPVAVPQEAEPNPITPPTEASNEASREVSTEIAPSATDEAAPLAPVPAQPIDEPVRLATRTSNSHGSSEPDLRITAQENQEERAWRIEVATELSAIDPDRVALFADRLHQVHGVGAAVRAASGAGVGPAVVLLRITCFGPTSRVDVEELVWFVWAQSASATKRSNATASI